MLDFTGYQLFEKQLEIAYAWFSTQEIKEPKILRVVSFDNTLNYLF